MHGYLQEKGAPSTLGLASGALASFWSLVVPWIMCMTWNSTSNRTKYYYCHYKVTNFTITVVKL